MGLPLSTHKILRGFRAVSPPNLSPVVVVFKIKILLAEHTSRCHSSTGDLDATHKKYSSAALKRVTKMHTEYARSTYDKIQKSSLHLRVAVLVDIDLVAPPNSRLVLLPQRPSRRTLLETGHPERLVDISRQRSLVERKLAMIRGGGDGVSNRPKPNDSGVSSRNRRSSWCQQTGVVFRHQQHQRHTERRRSYKARLGNTIDNKRQQRIYRPKHLRFECCSNSEPVEPLFQCIYLYYPLRIAMFNSTFAMHVNNTSTFLVNRASFVDVVCSFDRSILRSTGKNILLPQATWCRQRTVPGS